MLRLAVRRFSGLKGLLALLVLGIFLTTFSFGQNPKTDKLVILSPHWEGIRSEFTRAFKEYYQKIYGKSVDVEWLDQGGTADILRFIKSEFIKHPNGINVDLLFGGGTDPYLELVKLNLLQPYKVPKTVLQNIPAEFQGSPVYDKQYRWYGAALSGFGILRNEWIISRLQLPNATTWSDLTNYRLKGWIGSADPRTYVV